MVSAEPWLARSAAAGGARPTPPKLKRHCTMGAVAGAERRPVSSVLR